MSLFKSKKEFDELINEYYNLRDKIDINDLDIVKTISNEDKMMKCFYDLKKLQQKHPILCSTKENEEEVRNYLLNNLIDNYKIILVDIYQKNEEKNILQKLETLKKNISEYSTMYLSREIKSLLDDLNKKIENYDRYIIKNNDGKCCLLKLSDDEYAKKISENNAKRINKNYKLPSIDLLDEESKSIIPFIKKIIDEKNILIPIGNEKGIERIEGINSMPNMLVGGTVMSGKSAYINTIIGSVLLTKKPDEVKLVIYDSKRIEYSYCNGLPHLLCPVITNTSKLSMCLQLIISEIEHRYDLFEISMVKNIESYNKKIESENKNNGEFYYKMPYIIIVIDDYNSINSADEINSYIENITGNGWSAGIYMILASNHPSARVIPTVSKSNFPARLSFKVASIQSSQAILGDGGAEKITGYGNALYISRLTEKIVKVKVPYISELSMKNIVEHCIMEQLSYYDDRFLSSNIKNNNNSVSNEYEDEYDEPLYNDIVEFVVTTGKASASLLQRRFKLGYSRAAKVIDLLEARGIIGPMNGSKPREVLVKINNDDDDEII